MKYCLRSPIRHGGKRIEPPAVVEMPLLAAAPLLAAGAIHLAEGEPMQGWLVPDPQTIADLLAPLDLKRKPALKKALELLREQVDGSETEDGIALSIRDEDLTQADLDVAWALLTAPVAAAEASADTVTEAGEIAPTGEADAPPEGEAEAQP